MSDNDKKFIFHKDQFGVHVYHADMNPDKPTKKEILLNETIPFNPCDSCVVPQPRTLHRMVRRNKSLGYINNKTNEQITDVEFQTRKQDINNAVANATTIEEEVAAKVAKEHFDNDWEENTIEVDEQELFDFEVVDIEYPADDRLFPLRHLGDGQVNYFRVDGKRVAKTLMLKLCLDEGLKEQTDRWGDKARTFHVDDERYGGSIDWRIEGKDYKPDYGDHNISKAFVGHISECREYIHDIEAAVREAFDEWKISGRTAGGLTVKFLMDHIERIKRNVQSIQSKIKTQQEKDRAINQIELFKTEILAIAQEEFEQDNAQEENLSDQLDNALL